MPPVLNGGSSTVDVYLTTCTNVGACIFFHIKMGRKDNQRIGSFAVDAPVIHEKTTALFQFQKAPYEQPFGEGLFCIKD